MFQNVSDSSKMTISLPSQLTKLINLLPPPPLTEKKEKYPRSSSLETLPWNYSIFIVGPICVTLMHWMSFLVFKLDLLLFFQIRPSRFIIWSTVRMAGEHKCGKIVLILVSFLLLLGTIALNSVAALSSAFPELGKIRSFESISTT